MIERRHLIDLLVKCQTDIIFSVFFQESCYIIECLDALCLSPLDVLRVWSPYWVSWQRCTFLTCWTFNPISIRRVVQSRLYNATRLALLWGKSLLPRIWCRKTAWCWHALQNTLLCLQERVYCREPHEERGHHAQVPLTNQSEGSSWVIFVLSETWCPQQKALLAKTPIPRHWGTFRRMSRHHGEASSWMILILWCCTSFCI